MLTLFSCFKRSLSWNTGWGSEGGNHYLGFIQLFYPLKVFQILFSSHSFSKHPCEKVRISFLSLCWGNWGGSLGILCDFDIVTYGHDINIRTRTPTSDIPFQLKCFGGNGGTTHTKIVLGLVNFIMITNDLTTV